MPYDNRRPDRVAEAIREEVAMFLAEGVKDPRVRGMVTVTGVDVTRDLRHAKVFVSVLGEEAERTDTMAGLAGIATHLRGHIGRALRLRSAPELTFKYDQSVTHAARIETLLEQVRQERDGGYDDPAAPDDAAPDEAAPDDAAPDGAAADGAPADAGPAASDPSSG
jgi:ribosome-binding factor A